MLHAGKVVKFPQKLLGAADAVKGFFGAAKNQDSAVEKLEALRVHTQIVIARKKRRVQAEYESRV